MRSRITYLVSPGAQSPLPFHWAKWYDGKATKLVGLSWAKNSWAGWWCNCRLQKQNRRLSTKGEMRRPASWIRFDQRLEGCKYYYLRSGETCRLEVLQRRGKQPHSKSFRDIR